MKIRSRSGGGCRVSLRRLLGGEVLVFFKLWRLGWVVGGRGLGKGLDGMMIWYGCFLHIMFYFI